MLNGDFAVKMILVSALQVILGGGVFLDTVPALIRSAHKTANKDWWLLTVWGKETKGAKEKIDLHMDQDRYGGKLLKMHS